MTNAGHLTIKGQPVVFQFPNLSRCALAEQCGFGDSFRETWDKLKKDKDGAEFKRLTEAWPGYIDAVVVSPPDWMRDIEQLTAGEVLAIAVGFTTSGMEIRES